MTTNLSRSVLPVLLAVAAATIPAGAGTISLRWDPVPDADLAGYRVYYGTTQGAYDQHVDVGLVTETTLTGLADCTYWYVAVKAYDTGGLQSPGFSNEVSGWPRPVVSSPAPDAGRRGESLTITVPGSNFMSGATLQFSNPDISVDSTSVNSCGEIVAQIRIGPAAPLGATDLEVINPDRVFGQGLGLFTVTEAMEPAAITSQPDDAVVPEGRAATFSISASGAAPLSYQWRRDGVDIPGADSDTYTTPPATAADDGASFTCEVRNDAGSEESAPALLTVTVPGSRVVGGLVALYTFDDGAGSTVRDVSGVGSALDLTIEDVGAAVWTSNGLDFRAATRAATSGPSSKVTAAVKASGAITVEAWVDPANTSQTGPAPVASISSGSSSRNVTIGQEGSVWDAALRTTSTNLNGRPSLQSPASAVSGSQTHVVYARNASGTARLYVDGVERATTTVGGGLSNWDDAYALAVGNEAGTARPWLGEMQLLAFYDRALGAAEVAQNYDAGPDGDNPAQPNQSPAASFTADPRSGEAPLTVQFDATASTDPDGTLVSYQWDFGDGGSGSGVTTSHTYTSSGTFVVTLTVTDDDGATDSASDTVTVSEATVPPAVTSHPQDRTVNEGETATFSVGASGTEPLSYQWQRNGTDIAGATSPSYTTPPTTMADDGTGYRCVVRNAAGSDVSDPALLTVLDATPPADVSGLARTDVRP